MPLSRQAAEVQNQDPLRYAPRQRRRPQLLVRANAAVLVCETSHVTVALRCR
jgi:hypothetical protein